MKGKAVFLLLALLIWISCLPGTAFGISYYGYNEWGGTWHDADKTWGNNDDYYMCWAAAASNSLAWTGWGFPTNQSFSDHDDIFGYYQDHWTDNGGWMEYGWSWWFDGTEPPPGYSYVNVPGGNFWPTYTFGDYYYGVNYWGGDGSGALLEIDTRLTDGYGVTLAIYDGTFAHAITVWGYEYDDQGNYLGIYLTDSDDGVDELVSVGVAYNSPDNYWYLQDYNGSNDFFIYAIQALDQKPVPEPATMLLLGSGLISLAGFRRKFRKP